MLIRFQDRREAGRLLAGKLKNFANSENVIVLALPRGGVPVAYEVARNLNAPLDVFIVRKLGVPGQEELAFGAIAAGGIQDLNKEIIKLNQISELTIKLIAEREELEIKRRERLYREDKSEINVEEKTVILVDDGLATGASMQVAVKALKKQKAAKIIVAVPVASRENCENFNFEKNVQCVCVQVPETFYSVGMWYRDFSQTTDAEVCEMFFRAAREKTQFSKSAA